MQTMSSNSAFPRGFLWGAATAAHQIEGNNLNNDWWKLEYDAARYGVQFSGDADDSYHRYEEDMRLLADSGLNAYRFSVEWARPVGADVRPRGCRPLNIRASPETEP